MRNGEKLTSDFGKKMRSSVLEEKKIAYFCYDNTNITLNPQHYKIRIILSN